MSEKTQTTWQPIDTAPKDGTKILISGLDYGKGPGRHYAIAWWNGHQWWSELGDHSNCHDWKYADKWLTKCGEPQ